MTMYQHLQTLFMFLYTVFIFANVFQIPTIVILLTDWTPRLRYIYILYLCWMIYDRQAPYKEGRRWLWFRKLPLFHLYNDYFPIRLVKTADLKPDKNYLLAFYPHGVGTYGPYTTFGYYCNNVDKLYPNIEFSYVTINFALKTPILREIYLSVGGRSPDKSSVEYFLNSKPSKALLIIPDGAAGATFSRAGSVHYFNKKHRRGFIRMALKTGSSLVPIFSFGENNTLDNTAELSGWFKTFSDLCYKVTRIRMVLLNGAGLFQQSFGLMPRRVPITTVVGKPIAVPKIENPSDELVEEYLDKFFEELEKLFEKYKHKYDSAGSNAKMKYI